MDAETELNFPLLSRLNIVHLPFICRRPHLFFNLLNIAIYFAAIGNTGTGSPKVFQHPKIIFHTKFKMTKFSKCRVKSEVKKPDAADSWKQLAGVAL